MLAFCCCGWMLVCYFVFVCFGGLWFGVYFVVGLLWLCACYVFWIFLGLLFSWCWLNSVVYLFAVSCSGFCLLFFDLINCCFIVVLGVMFAVGLIVWFGRLCLFVEVGYDCFTYGLGCFIGYRLACVCLDVGALVVGCLVLLCGWFADKFVYDCVWFTVLWCFWFSLICSVLLFTCGCSFACMWFDCFELLLFWFAYLFVMV